jgi:general secretion pathway protein K
MLVVDKFPRKPRAARGQRGVALLAVLWLSAALTLIAMSTAYVVRTEAVAVGNHIEAERAGWLARGAAQAGIYAILHSGNEGAAPGGEAALTQRLNPGQRWLGFDLEGGRAVVEVVPENAKLNINQASVEQLAALFVLLGKPDLESRELAEAIADWRSPRTSSVATPFDMFYEGLAQPYQARHAPLEELEELLAVKGMDRDLFFGNPWETPGGEWRRTSPLADLLTTEPNFGGVNVNYAAYEVLRVLPGWDESLARAVIEARTQNRPGTLMDAVPELSRVASVSAVSAAPGINYTLTATAQMAGSGVRRSVRARIRVDRTVSMGFQVTGWWEDWPWSLVSDKQFDWNGS